jgi:hypothetical protein
MPPKLTKEIIAAAIEGFEEQKRRIDLQIAELRGDRGSSEPAAETSATRTRRKMSAAGRRAIAEAQRKRWAAKTAPELEAPAKPKRKLSAAGRAAIIAATKKRWAAKKAAEK